MKSEEELKEILNAIQEMDDSKIDGNATWRYYPYHSVALYRNEYGDLIKTVILVHDGEMTRYSKDYSTIPCWKNGGDMVEDSDIISDLNGIERMARGCNRRIIDGRNLDWLADELLRLHHDEY